MIYKVSFLVRKDSPNSDITEEQFKEWIHEELLDEGLDLEENPMEFACLENHIEDLRIEITENKVS